jgi:hypothetical protein
MEMKKVVETKIKLILEWPEIRQVLDKHIRETQGYTENVKLLYAFFDITSEEVDLDRIVVEVEGEERK